MDNLNLTRKKPAVTGRALFLRGGDRWDWTASKYKAFEPTPSPMPPPMPPHHHRDPIQDRILHLHRSFLRTLH
jgi:hypothetical protein